MAELLADSRRCNYFFLYDGSKVKGEGDPTSDGICYFYPEETPIDHQELLCGQLAGVSRCVSELSSSPVRVLRLHRNKFAIRMKDDLFWALGCSVDIATVSACDLLDQLINLFCFYNGPVRQSYQVNSRETLALRWLQYLSHLQAGSTDLHHVFSCLSTIDSTHIDPLLLLKAALILQACQRCPLVLAGCVLFCGRVVSTQMPPELTVKVMAHDRETHGKDARPNGLSSFSSSGSAPVSRAVTSTTVFLTTTELHGLRSSLMDTESSSHSTPKKDPQPRRSRLSRTLSDTPSTDSDPVETDVFDPLSPAWDPSVFSPSPTGSRDSRIRCLPPLNTPGTSFPNGEAPNSGMEEDALDKTCYYSFHSNGGGPHVNGEESSLPAETCPLPRGAAPTGDSLEASGNGEPHGGQAALRGSRAGTGSAGSQCGQTEDPPPLCTGLGDSGEESPLVPMTLYQHRVKGLVLALLVEPLLQSDTAAMEEVYHSSLASLNGLEAHLRNITLGAPGPHGPYIFAHFDCIQNTLTTNVSGRSGGVQERSFVRATSLLHSHFCNSEALQEAIIRNAGSAVYGTRSVAQETYFLQQGGVVRNSGIPNAQDSAFSLPSKARHRLLKHGVNLL